MLIELEKQDERKFWKMLEDYDSCMVWETGGFFKPDKYRLYLGDKYTPQELADRKAGIENMRQSLDFLSKRVGKLETMLSEGVPTPAKKSKQRAT